jgi:hypothetical protein
VTTIHIEHCDAAFAAVLVNALRYSEGRGQRLAHTRPAEESDQDAQLLASAFVTNESVRHVRLWSNWNSDVFVAELADALGVEHPLDRIEFWCNDVRVNSATTTPPSLPQVDSSASSHISSFPISASDGAPPPKQLFYVSSSNGGALLQELLEARGWERIPVAPRGEAHKVTSFKLKWCELSSSFDFDAFDEKKQIIARNPCIDCLADKLEMRNTLYQYEEACRAMQKEGGELPTSYLHTDEFIPLTFELTDGGERAVFSTAVQSKPASEWRWICKPTALGCGRGILVVDDVGEFLKRWEQFETTVRVYIFFILQFVNGDVSENVTRHFAHASLL